MALLDDTNRSRVWAQAMRQPELGSLPGMTKVDLRAAVDATDAWIDANSGSFNAALPLTFRTNASLTQKTILFCWVAMRRAGLFRAQEDG